MKDLGFYRFYGIKKLFIRALLSNNFFMKSGFWRKIMSSRGKYCSSQSRSRYSYCLAIKCKCLCHFKLPFRRPIKRMNSEANNKVFCFNSLCMLIAFTLFIKGCDIGTQSAFVSAAINSREHYNRLFFLGNTKKVFNGL